MRGRGLYLLVVWMCLASCADLVWATAVYDCNSWPGGSLALASIVDCPDSTFSSSGVPSELWSGPKFLIDVARTGLAGSLNFTSPANSTRSISVRGNALTGSLPQTLPGQLKDLDLSKNNFVGALPATWSAATALRSIDLNGNGGVTGTLPTQWSALTKLEHLDLRGTQMGGNIQQDLGALVRLSAFLVDGCNFTGCVPLGIPFSVPSLQVDGFLLKQCTGAPTQSPSKAPTTSKPSSVPSGSPSAAPTVRPTRRPTSEPETEAPSSDAGTGVASGPSPVAVGVGLGVGFVALFIFAATFLFWRRSKSGRTKTAKSPPTSASKSSSKIPQELTPAETAGVNPPGPPPRPPPPPAGPRPGRTFVPGVGWVQDRAGASSGARYEAAPPPEPKKQ